MRFSKVCFFIVVMLVATMGWAQEDAVPPFSSRDRVLVLVPHPDDEAIAAGGVLQRVVDSKAALKIVYLTNGDNNEPAFIVYSKRLVMKKRAFIYLGEVRRKESLRALNTLGIQEKDAIFLGYPDFGTLRIFTQYWSDGETYKSMFTRVRKVPYKECFTYCAPYTGESILTDLKMIIEDFQPTKIFVSHPVDTNGDHRAFYLFLQVALWDLGGRIKTPQVYPYLVHVVGWPKPRGYRPHLTLQLPRMVKSAGIGWRRLDLSSDEVVKKKDMIHCFRSQIECNPPYLYSFARKNEFFGDYPEIPVKQQRGVINWMGLEERASGLNEEKDDGGSPIDTLAYSVEDGSLYIKVRLDKALSVNMGVNLYLFGYNKDVPFASMPKLRIRIGFRGETMVFDKRKQVAADDIEVKEAGANLVVRCPLKRLGGPDRILSCVRASNKGLPQYETAWRKLKLE